LQGELVFAEATEEKGAKAKAENVLSPLCASTASEMQVFRQGNAAQRHEFNQDSSRERQVNGSGVQFVSVRFRLVLNGEV
jgi:hypothetical protein